MKLSKIGILIGVLTTVWLALFISNHAMLVWSSVDEEGPGQRLVCRYFTGSGVVKRQHLRLGQLGREACPRWISLGER